MFVPLYGVLGKMENMRVKIDSNGRLCLPANIREQFGDVAVLKKTPEGYLLIPGKQADFLQEFRRVISSEPKRTAKPEFLSPEKMKAIWKTKV